MAVSQMNGRTSRQRAGAQRRYETTYIDGNVVRHIQTAPERASQQRERRSRSTEVNTRRNREKALNMTMPYVMFLAAASIATVFLCVNYLKLQAQGTTLRREITSMESRLSTMRLANDNAYEEALSSVNMEQVKEIAVSQLGMVYADDGQVITYNSQNGDFIRQYMEVPEQ